VVQAGLFSTVTYAFVIQVHSQLQPDPNEETAALLRVLIYKIDNITFGDDVPTVPQWSGPPRTIVQAEAILYASLATSIFSAFLAILGKQWLNRYASIDTRGSTIERGHNRQQKLDGIVNWSFHHVMESLPLMLQFALLLLSCTLSLYFWGIDTAVALVVVCITSFGVVFYALIVIAGAAFVNCPYQTPGAQILRHTSSLICMLPSAFLSIANNPMCISAPISWFKWTRKDGLIISLCRIPGGIVAFLFLIIHDACNLLWTDVLLTLARGVKTGSAGYVLPGWMCSHWTSGASCGSSRRHWTRLSTSRP